MSEPTPSEIMKEIGALNQKITMFNEQAREHHDKIEEHISRDDKRLDVIERWIHDSKVRGEERDRIEEEIARSKGRHQYIPPDPKPQQATPVSFTLDQKLTKAIVAFLAAATSFLIFLQAPGG